MSVQVMSWVIEHSPHKGGDLLCLLMVANHANADGTEAYPSIDTLAKKCRMSERQIRRILDRLEAAGALLIQRARGRSRHHSMTVVMGPPNKPDKMTGISPKAGQSDRLSGVKPDKMTGFGSEKPDISDNKTGHRSREAPELTVLEPSLLLTTVPIADAKPDGAEAMHAVLSAFADRGYDVTPAFLRALAAKHPGIDLAVEAYKVEEWLTEPRNAKRKCNKRFLDNWLTKAGQPSQLALGAPAAPSPGGLVHPNSQRKNPGPEPVLPEGVELQPVRPADVERELAERKRIPYEQRLALMRNGAAPAPAGGAA